MSRPRYVDRGGDLVLRQPIENRQTTSYAWMIAADWDALCRLCDRAFTEPSGGAVVVRPLLPMVAVIAADIGHGQSADPIDHAKGWSGERDLGFWVPVARGRLGGDDGDRFELEQIAWYQPYLFVDNAAGVFTGRETYGFAKSIATCTMPDGPGEPSRFAVETLAIERFAPTSQAAPIELYAVERADRGPLGALDATFDSLVEAILKVEGRLLLRGFGPGSLPAPTWELIKNLAHDLRQSMVPMMFLKQFRDVDDSATCCYQAIVEAPCRLTAWHGGGFLDNHVLTIRHADSHPIAADLGLPSGPIETGWGFWASYDFTVLPGTVRWQAGR
jgi:hypothetical protein